MSWTCLKLQTRPKTLCNCTCITFTGSAIQENRQWLKIYPYLGENKQEAMKWSKQRWYTETIHQYGSHHNHTINQLHGLKRSLNMPVQLHSHTWAWRQQLALAFDLNSPGTPLEKSSPFWPCNQAGSWHNTPSYLAYTNSNEPSSRADWKTTTSLYPIIEPRRLGIRRAATHTSSLYTWTHPQSHILCLQLWLL